MNLLGANGCYKGAGLLQLPALIKNLGIEEDRAVANIRLVGIDILCQVELETIVLIFQVAAEHHDIRAFHR